MHVDKSPYAAKYLYGFGIKLQNFLSVSITPRYLKSVENSWSLYVIPTDVCVTMWVEDTG